MPQVPCALIPHLSLGAGVSLFRMQKSVRRMFRDWDQDFSGSLDTGEFVAALDKHGFKTSPEEALWEGQRRGANRGGGKTRGTLGRVNTVSCRLADAGHAAGGDADALPR